MECPLWSVSSGFFDPDNDGDGIYDADDECPDQAEDRDGFQDIVAGRWWGELQVYVNDGAGGPSEPNRKGTGLGTAVWETWAGRRGDVLERAVAAVQVEPVGVTRARCAPRTVAQEQIEVAIEIEVPPHRGLGRARRLGQSSLTGHIGESNRLAGL